MSSLSPIDYWLCFLFRFGKKVNDAVDSDDQDEEDEEEEEKEVEKVKSKDKKANENIDYIDSNIDEDNFDGALVDAEDEDFVKTENVDVFSKHFFENFTSSDIETIKQNNQVVSTKHNWPGLGSFTNFHQSDVKYNLVKVDKPYQKIEQLQLRPILTENMSKTMMTRTRNQSNSLTPLQHELLGLMSSYKSVLFTEQTLDNGEQIRVSYCAHALNHVLKTRSRIVSHNARINQNKTEKEEYRDQGLTRPKVLIVVPFRESAYQVVECMIELLFGDAKDSGTKKIIIMNYKRFKTEFGENEEEHISQKKPEDYKKIFAGNIDDSFRVGLSITKKSLKIYSDFYSSDIIIASPLGLRLIVGANGDEQRDYDFLSSMEIVIFDQMDIFLMQNWEHVLHLMNHIHLQPKETHNVDFSRVKLYVLELWSKYYYQLLAFSSVSTTLINGFFNKFATGYAGKIIVKNEVPRAKAAINRVYIQCPQVFHRFECNKFADNSDVRFNFFVNKVLPKFKDKLMVRTLIYVPSYFDFVRLRNYFRTEDIGFSQMCEYTKTGKVAKARHIFFYGGRHFMLFTERFHFFNRYTIKGIRHLIFYEPPSFPNFYSEMVNSMHLSNQGKKLATDYSSMSVTVLFNRYDAHSLVSLVGSKTATALLQSDTDVHMFITEKTS